MLVNCSVIFEGNTHNVPQSRDITNSNNVPGIRPVLDTWAPIELYKQYDSTIK